MTTLADYKAGHPKILLLGRVGSGKSLLATTLGKRCLVLDMNNGLVSAQRYKDKFSAQRLECEVKNCWDAGKPDAMWARCVAYIQSFCAKPSHEALVIDGLTDLAMAALGSQLQGSGKWDESSIASIAQKDWGNGIMLLQRVMYRLRSVPAVVVLIAHTKLVSVGKPPDTVDQERISVYGKNLGNDIMSLFDEVWYTNVTGGGTNRKFQLQTVTSSGVQCKTRRQLPNNTDMNIGLPKLLESIGHEWKKEVVKEG